MLTRRTPAKPDRRRISRGGPNVIADGLPSAASYSSWDIRTPRTSLRAGPFRKLAVPTSLVFNARSRQLAVRASAAALDEFRQCVGTGGRSARVSHARSLRNVGVWLARRISRQHNACD